MGSNVYNKEKKNKKGKKILLSLILLLLAAAMAAVLTLFRLDTVRVEGAVHYTQEEIKSMFLGDGLSFHSLYVYWKYHDKKIENTPFIDRLDTTLASPGEVVLTVYEKDIIGYFQYLGKYLYFDRDGMLVETSDKALEGIPQITGLKFDHFVISEQLPVEKERVFQIILRITRLLQKYEVTPDRVYFNEKLEMTMYFSGAKVLLGEEDNLEDKIAGLKQMIPKMGELSGTLHMERYTKDSPNVTFKKE